ncbi:MAG: hypothetical protein OXI87_17265 [Albidovulum sp.]|nr:hypothetical protein [Albidovulum sp.]MDE0530510.1 hypothetical protein [Albidovulum sp.]
MAAIAEIASASAASDTVAGAGRSVPGRARSPHIGGSVAAELAPSQGTFKSDECKYEAGRKHNAVRRLRVKRDYANQEPNGIAAA